MLHTRLCTLATVAVAIGVLGCAARPSAIAPRSALEATVYAAMISALRQPSWPDTLLLAESTLVFQAAHIPASNRRVPFDTVPAALRTKLAVVSRERRSSTTLPIIAPLRIVSDGELRTIFRGGPMDGWAEFYRRYPKQRAWYAFSPIAFSADSSQAYVYYEYHCGGLCGGGTGLWFIRARGDSIWSLRLRAPYWIS